MSEAGIHKARLKQHVQDLQTELEIQYIQQVEAQKAPIKARAIEIGQQLMRSAKSEAVRARMVEFFAGERSQPLVNVAVQVNNRAPDGYEFVRPGQRVEVVDHED